MPVWTYGSHPTSLSGLSDEQLYGMFRYSSWMKLDNDQRQELMQETVNRAAAAHGEIGSQEVTFRSYTDVIQTPNGPQVQTDLLTVAQNGRNGISVNSNLYTQGRDITSWGQKDQAAGLHVLEALLHENEHAYQDQVNAGVIQPQDPDAARQYKANDFTQGLVLLEDGSFRTGSQYIVANTTSYKQDNYYLYYLSSTERDAFRFSQEKTLEIAKAMEQDIRNELNEMIIRDPEHYMETSAYQTLKEDYVSVQTYVANLEQSGYQAMLEDAQAAYQDPSIEQDINTVLTNHYYHENTAVPANVEKAVNEAMVLSYQIQNGQAPQVQTESINVAQNTAAHGNTASLDIGESAETAASPHVGERMESATSSEGGGSTEPAVSAPNVPSVEISQDLGVSGNELEDDGGMEM